jgi:choline-glycine betaine transporter
MFRNPLLLTALSLTAAVSVWGLIDTQGLAQFAAGMGVRLLFYGAAEPISHFLFLHQGMPPQEAASQALFLTYFHWGLHAWAIYGLTGLVIAYFMFRRQALPLISSPVRVVFGDKPWTRSIGWLMDLLAIYAMAIGLAGSIALGVFQVQDGVASLFHIQGAGLGLGLTIFAMLCLICTLPLLEGPTQFFMRGIVEGFGRHKTKKIQAKLSNRAYNEILIWMFPALPQCQTESVD